MKVVIFKIDDEEYGAGINQVERILELDRITRIPDSPDYLKGIINYQGRVIPIIDLKRRLGLSECVLRQDSKLIVARQDKGDVGMVIDSVTEVIDITSDQLSSPPGIISGILKKYVKSVIKLQDRLIIYLNLGEVLDFNERKAISEAVEEANQSESLN
jgi:purine-binding chemotaxis protein CheW